MSDRIRKINEVVREQASKAVSENLTKDFFVTVTAVETTRDLKKAIIWVSSFSDEKEVLEELNSKKSDIQHAITEKMYSKYTPKIEFKFDHSQEHAEKIDRLLRGDDKER